jgi:hypothetical protein
LRLCCFTVFVVGVTSSLHGSEAISQIQNFSSLSSIVINVHRERKDH